MGAPFQTIPITHLDLTSQRGKQVLQDALDQLVAMFSAGRINTENMDEETRTTIESVELIGATSSFTPTSSWVTNVTISGRYDVLGRRLHLQYYIALSGAPTTATLTLELPALSGYVVDETALPNSGDVFVGYANLYDGATTGRFVPAVYSTVTNNLKIGLTPNGTVGYVTQAAPWVWGSGDSISVDVWLPMTTA